MFRERRRRKIDLETQRLRVRGFEELSTADRFDWVLVILVFLFLAFAVWRYGW